MQNSAVAFCTGRRNARGLGTKANVALLLDLNGARRGNVTCLLHRLERGCSQPVKDKQYAILEAGEPFHVYGG
jgi:hypothetical protein